MTTIINQESQPHNMVNKIINDNSGIDMFDDLIINLETILLERFFEEAKEELEMRKMKESRTKRYKKLFIDEKKKLKQELKEEEDKEINRIKKKLEKEEQKVSKLKIKKVDLDIESDEDKIISNKQSRKKLK